MAQLGLSEGFVELVESVTSSVALVSAKLTEQFASVTQSVLVTGLIELEL